MQGCEQNDNVACMQPDRHVFIEMSEQGFFCNESATVFSAKWRHAKYGAF
jgi:hypothetical protein